jgi:hypothetical protein
MTQRDLARRERQYRKAVTASEVARRSRNDAVRQALESGMTHAQIAMVTGLTRGRIGQIASS